jgi:hypothetical protein
VASLDPTSQLAALMRGQVAALRQRQIQPPQRKKPSPPRDIGTTADMATVVALKIRSIREDDPQRNAKAFRFFLETVLLSELGQDLVGDPGFEVLLNEVETQMRADPALKTACRQAAEFLLESASPI